MNSIFKNLYKKFVFQVFPYDVPVKNLLVVRESDQLIVLSEQEVAALSLHRCQAANKVTNNLILTSKNEFSNSQI